MIWLSGYIYIWLWGVITYTCTNSNGGLFKLSLMGITSQMKQSTSYWWIHLIRADNMETEQPVEQTVELTVIWHSCDVTVMDICNSVFLFPCRWALVVCKPPFWSINPFDPLYWFNWWLKSSLASSIEEHLILGHKDNKGPANSWTQGLYWTSFLLDTSTVWKSLFSVDWCKDVPWCEPIDGTLKNQTFKWKIHVSMGPSF